MQKKLGGGIYFKITFFLKKGAAQGVYLPAAVKG
jgi:hypothetical protein